MINRNYSDLVLGLAFYLIDCYVQPNRVRQNVRKENAVLQEKTASMEELYTMQLS